MEGRGTPDQSQAGPGEPTRDTITIVTPIAHDLVLHPRSLHLICSFVRFLWFLIIAAPTLSGPLQLIAHTLPFTRIIYGTFPPSFPYVILSFSHPYLAVPFFRRWFYYIVYGTPSDPSAHEANAVTQVNFFKGKKKKKKKLRPAADNNEE